VSKIIHFQVSPEEAKNEAFLVRRISEESGVPADQLRYRWNKRSIDARKANIKINCSFEVFEAGESTG
jgi:hypothetical protein